MFQDLNYKKQKKMSDVLPNQQKSSKSCTVMHVRRLRYPIKFFTMVLCSYRAGVLKRRCGETV